MLHLRRESLTALKFAAAGGLGFVTDISILGLCLRVLHMSAFAGRAISLPCAMQVTFLVNGLLVFRSLTWSSWGRQWLAYMATNGLGNLINYLVFAALVASRLPGVSRHGWALVIGCLLAYAFNFACARLVVFGRPCRRRRRAPGVCDAAAKP